MFNANNIKIDLNVLQLMKFGLHIGENMGKINFFSYPYIKGQKNRISFLNMNQTLIDVKKLVLLTRKFLSKKQEIFTPNTKDSLFFEKFIFSCKRKAKNGFLTNKEFTVKTVKRFYGKNYVKNRLSNSFLNFSKASKTATKMILKKKTKKIPSFSIFLPKKNMQFSILETRKKKLLSAMVVNNSIMYNPYTVHYPIVVNNSSFSSSNYFNKIFF